jgi:hypothetical protein
LYEAYERLKGLKRNFPNHNLDSKEKMQIFTGCMKMQHMMLFDASAGGSIKNKTGEEVKGFIEQMCQKENNSNNECLYRIILGFTLGSPFVWEHVWILEAFRLYLCL